MSNFSDYEAKELENTKKVVRDLSRLVNKMSYDGKTFAKEVLKEHRTLQQSMFSTMLETMKLWAESYDSGRYDMRNEYTVKKSKEIMDLVDGLTSTPFI